MELDAATLNAIVAQVGRDEGLDPDWLRAIIRVESAGRPAVVSSAGAIGLMQLLPSTAAELGVDPWDPWQNVYGGARYYKQKLAETGGDANAALASYNMGFAGMVRATGFPADGWWGRLPSGVQAYVIRIRKAYEGNVTPTTSSPWTPGPEGPTRTPPVVTSGGGGGGGVGGRGWSLGGSVGALALGALLIGGIAFATKPRRAA